MKAPIITAAFLRNNHACTIQRRKFVRVFGKDGASLTVANAVKAIKAGLNFSWIAYKTVPYKIEGKIERAADRSPEGKAVNELYRSNDRAQSKIRDKIIKRRLELAQSINDGLYSSACYAAMAKDPEYKALRKQEDALDKQYDKDYAKAYMARDIVYARLIVPYIRKYWV